MTLRWALALASVSAACCAFAIGLARADEVESGVNRPFSDYKHFELEPSIAGHGPCKSACEYDEKCKAWTFAPSGVRGPKAQCWLKNSAPKPVKDKNYTSGIPVRAHGCELGGVVRMDILDRDCQEAQATGCVKRLLSDSAYKACLRAQPVRSSGCLIAGVVRKDIDDRDCREAQQTGCIKRLLTQKQYDNCLQAQKSVVVGGGGGKGGGSTSQVPAEWSDMLKAHNDKRKLHCTPALTWSADLAAKAQAWANKCTNTHDAGGGENLAFFYPVGQSNAHAFQNSWYCEVQWYDFNNPKLVGGFKKGCDAPVNGHFTQVVWKGTTQLGCGKQTCTMGGLTGTYWVCKYAPGGNRSDTNSLKQNVLPPNC